MSRIGKQPILIPAGVTFNASGRSVSTKGPRGELSWDLPSGIRVKSENNEIQVERDDELKLTRSLHGTSRSLIANMVEGVEKGFQKDLVLEGIGFRSSVEGTKLVIQAGFSHPLEFEITGLLKVEVAKDGTISVSGPDKQQVGAFAAAVRYAYPAEPYKGKGVRYKGEQIRRKAGKTVS